ncbi:MAG: arylesterase [Lachnospiraceae bacterium]|nr:arylesterase [Lachnospiraceae bacterium]
METILAFGDSNTWGLIPGAKTYERYPWEVRWTGLLQQKCEKNRILEEGLCGRTTVFEDKLRPGRRGITSLPILLESHQPLNAAVLMLGTNDCKSIYGANAYTIGEGIELCLNELEKYIPKERILLVSPIFLGEDVWKPEKDPEFEPKSIEVSHELKDIYSKIAKRRGTGFLAASDFAKADEADNEHLNESGHRALAVAVYKKLGEMNVL